MVRLLHWLALRLGILASILALVLLAPLAVPIALVPVRGPRGYDAGKKVLGHGIDPHRHAGTA